MNGRSGFSASVAVDGKFGAKIGTAGGDGAAVCGAGIVVGRSGIGAVFVGAEEFAARKEPWLMPCN